MKKSYFIYWLKPLQWNMFHWKAHHKFNVDPKEIKDLSCTPSNELFNKVKQLIEEGRTTIAQTVNVALTATYWKIGKKINEEVLRNQRADKLSPHCGDNYKMSMAADFR